MDHLFWQKMSGLYGVIWKWRPSAPSSSEITSPGVQTLRVVAADDPTDWLVEGATAADESEETGGEGEVYLVISW